nr:immunoglobulin light chain junction region [Macaca mulatta]
CLQYKSHPLTF